MKTKNLIKNNKKKIIFAIAILVCSAFGVPELAPIVASVGVEVLKEPVETKKTEHAPVETKKTEHAPVETKKTEHAPVETKKTEHAPVETKKVII